MLPYERTIRRALARITAGYVFPEKAVDIDVAVRRRLAAGEYDNVGGPVLCETVTAHVQKVCSDKRLRLLEMVEPQSLDPRPEDEDGPRFSRCSERRARGIRRVEHVDGHIGLIDVRRVASTAEGAAATGAAMQLVAHGSALVMDLRACHGGAPEGATCVHVRSPRSAARLRYGQCVIDRRGRR